MPEHCLTRGFKAEDKNHGCPKAARETYGALPLCVVYFFSEKNTKTCCEKDMYDHLMLIYTVHTCSGHKTYTAHLKHQVSAT